MTFDNRYNSSTSKAPFLSNWAIIVENLPKIWLKMDPLALFGLQFVDQPTMGIVHDVPDKAVTRLETVMIVSGI